MGLLSLVTQLLGGGVPLSRPTPKAEPAVELGAAPRTRAAKGTPDTPELPLDWLAKPKPRSGWRNPYRSRMLSSNITPAQIAAAMRKAESGRPQDLVRILHEVEKKDLLIGSQFGKRRRAVTKLDWSVEPASDRARDRRIAAWVDDQIRAIPGWHRTMSVLLDALSKGYAVVELEWAHDADGRVIVKRALRRPQWWFHPHPEDPEVWCVVDEAEPVTGVPIHPRRFIVHEASAVAGWPYEAGLGQGVLFFWMLKRFGLSDWASFMELYGHPMRIGKYSPGTKPDDINRLEDALEQLGLDTYAVIAADMEIDFITARGQVGPEVWERMVSRCDEQISIGILGQTLTTSQGTKGSQALGKVHYQVQQDLAEADARDLEDTLTRQLVEPLVQFNWGDVPVPRLVIDTDPPADEKVAGEVKESRARQFRQAVALGVPISIEQVREELDLREPLSDEDILAPGAPEPAPEPSEDPPKGRPQGLPARRPVRAHSGHVHVLADRAQLPAWMQQVEEAADRFRQEGGLLAWSDLLEGMKDALKGATHPGEVPDRFVQAVQAFELEDLARSLADATMTAELLAEVQAAAGDVPILDVPPVPPREAIDWWTTKTAMLPADFAALDAEHLSQAFTIAGYASLSALDEARSIFGDVVLQGGGTLADFEDALDAAGHRRMSPRHLEMVYGNNVGTAMSVGRYRQMTRPASLERRPFFRFNNPDDSRTSQICAAMVGRLWPAGHPIWDVWWPMNHHLCRSWVSAHDAEAVRAAGWVVEEELPVDLGTGSPLVPDAGWDRNPAKTPHEFDFSAFPSEWVEALALGAT